MIGAKPKVIVPSFQYAVNRIVGESRQSRSTPYIRPDKAGLIRNSYQASILGHSYEWQKYHYSLILHYIVNAARELVDLVCVFIYTLHIHGYQTKEPESFS